MPKRKPKKTRAAIIQSKREAAGLTRAELAVKSQLSRQTIWVAESTRPVAMSTLEAIATALRVTVKELLP
jgi:transcriptional regulator with XRE-family HTH domain